MSLEFFFSRLSPVARDQLVSVVTEAVSDDCPARVAQLESEIDSLRRVLDEKHSARESLKERLAVVDMLIASIAQDEASARNKDLEVTTLKLWLGEIRRDLDTRLGSLHVDKELREKRERTHERDPLLARRELANAVCSRLFPNQVPPQVVSKNGSRPVKV